MNNFIKMLGTIALIAVIGLGMVACATGGGGGSGKPLHPAGTLETSGSLTMAYIPPGRFLMGSPEGEPGRVDFSNAHDLTQHRIDQREDPQHWVTLTKGFWMGTTEVTQKLFTEVFGYNPSTYAPPDGEHYRSGFYWETAGLEDVWTDQFPVDSADWYMALVFCNKLSVKDGLTPAYSILGSTDPDVWMKPHGGVVPTSERRGGALVLPFCDPDWDNVIVVPNSTGYRLPTEAQWEYACRAGTNAAYNFGDNIDPTKANYESTFLPRRTTQVGSFLPNAWGLYDMHGNVSEWCWDWNGLYYGWDETDPTGPMPPSMEGGHVVRGGTYSYPDTQVRSAFRTAHVPAYSVSGSALGIRLVRPE